MIQSFSHQEPEMRTYSKSNDTRAGHWWREVQRTLTPGLPTAEEEVGGAGCDGNDGGRDGQRGLQPLALQELHAPAPFPSPPLLSRWFADRGWFDFRFAGRIWSGLVVSEILEPPWLTGDAPRSRDGVGARGA